MSKILQFPVTLEISSALIRLLKELGISTSWDIGEFDQGKGWLSSLHSYTFKRQITIEGPSAFYGGVYGPNAWTAEGGLCDMGAASYSHSPLPEGMSIGRYCSIGKGLRFLDFTHPIFWLSSSVAFFKPLGVHSVSALANLVDRLGHEKGRGFERLDFDPKQGKKYPLLGHDVWIGEDVFLAMGIKIGTGAVVAAGSTVTRDVPPYAIVAGAPATIKKYRFEQGLIDELLALQWWKYCYSDFDGMDVRQPKVFLRQLSNKINAEVIQQWLPRTIVLPDV